MIAAASTSVLSQPAGARAASGLACHHFRAAGLVLSVAYLTRLVRPITLPSIAYSHVAGYRFVEIVPDGPEPAPERVQSLRQLCLTTGDTTSTVERLRSVGVTIRREIREGLDHNLLAWIRDPDGNDHELMQLSKASPQRSVGRGQWSARPHRG